MDTIITISRQFGSGGRLIGEKLANELGIPFYDKEIISLAAEKSGLANEFIQENEQKMKSINFFAFGSTFMGGNLWSNVENIETRIYACEAEAIKNLASQGACVIVGRCADYVLKDSFKCMNVFIHADMESRKKRITEVYGMYNDEKKVDKLIRANDRARAKHYEFYTDALWGNSINYDMTLNSAKFGLEGAVEALKCAYLKFDSAPKNVEETKSEQ
ncbi:MAG: cytidylate kinase-like family protein [Clostridia bacterium]